MEGCILDTVPGASRVSFMDGHVLCYIMYTVWQVCNGLRTYGRGGALCKMEHEKELM
jgi:hypothetical protein